MMSVALFIYACRTDHLPENETAYNNSSKFQLTSKRISLDDAKHKVQIIPELNKVETGLKNSKTNINGKVIDYGNGVSIDTNNVIYIENGPNYHTYTFYIKRENAPADAPVENLVLSPMADGTYKEVLVSYQFTQAEKEILNNGGLVDTKGKTTITELANGTYSPLAKGMTACGWTETYTIVGCSDVHNGVSTHNAGNVESWGGCKADRKPGLYMTMTYRCDFTGMTDDIGNPSNPGGSSGSSGGGSSTGETGSNNDNNDPGNNTSPCPNGGTLTEPPGLTTDPGDGNCSGIPTQINLPDRKTPCEKTKALLEDPVLTAKVGTLKEKSKIEEGQPGYGESAVEINNDGTTSPIIPGGDHEVDLGSSAGKKGAYHNHTPEGVKMFSPADILKMLTYSLTQPIGNLSNGFLGMVGSERCSNTTTCPDGYKYHNYIIRFSGNSQELEDYLFKTIWDKDDLSRTYSRSKIELSKDTNFANYKYGPLNVNGLEKLFFETLRSMGMEGKVNLQRIEDKGIIQNIKENNNGDITATPCP